jgi:AhpD family alkylhydroperoxidase
MTKLLTRSPRLSNDVANSPEVFAGVQQIVKSVYSAGVPRHTLDLVHMRASQINGCSACIAYGTKSAQDTGLATERLVALPGWRESPLYDDGERAALELTEAMTRLADHPDVVSDEIWGRVAEHFEEQALGALVSMIGLTNFFNRVNTTLRVQPVAWE